MNFYAIFDSRAKNYFRPIPESTEANALRGFDHVVNSAESVLRQYPDDFSLHEIGAFDMSTGAITPTFPTRIIKTVKEVMRDLPTGQQPLPFPSIRAAAVDGNPSRKPEKHKKAGKTRKSRKYS